MTKVFPTVKKPKNEAVNVRKPGYLVSDPDATYADIPADVRQKISDDLMQGLPDTVVRRGV